MDGRVVSATATWKGQGSWTPAYFCFSTRTSRLNKINTCKPDPNSQLALQKGDKITITCKYNPSWRECDDDDDWKNALNEN